MMIRVGLLGYGYAGRNLHSYLVQHTQGLQLVAVASPSSEKRQLASQDYDVTTYASLEQLLNDDRIQLVIIATPHYLHAEQAILTMNAGKHCVVDKVMAMNAAEAQAMIAAAECNHVLLSVFQNRRWDWDFLTVKEVLKTGLIGEPFRFASRMCRYRAPQRWRADKSAMGGILYDWGSHLIDQALQLMATMPVNVYCHISHQHWPIDIGTHCQLLLNFPNDVVFEIEISYLCQIKKPRWTVLGTLGALQKYGLDPQEAAILAGNLALASEDAENHMQLSYQQGGVLRQQSLESVRGYWLSYYENIVDAINGRAELLVKPSEIKSQMLILDAASQSAASQQVVNCKNEIYVKTRN